MLVVDIWIVIAQQLQFLSLISFLKSYKTLWNLRDRIEYYSFTASNYQQAIEKRQWDKGMLEAIANQDMEMIQFFERKGATCWSEALKEAAMHSPTDNLIIKYIEQKGAEKWNWGMYGAAEAGNTQLVQYFIGKGANDFDQGLLHAVHGGNKDLVKLFFAKMRHLSLSQNRLLYMIEEAAVAGHLEVLKFLSEVSNHANKYCYWWRAARFNRKCILDYARTQHEMCRTCMEIAVREASHGNHRTLLEEIFACSNGKIDTFWKRVFIEAVSGGHKELAKYAWEQPNNEVSNPNTWIGSALQEAACQGEKEIVKWLLPQYEWCDDVYSVGMIVASARNGWRDVLEVVSEQAKEKLIWKHVFLGFTAAVQGGHIDVIEHFIQLLKAMDRYDPDSGLRLAAESGNRNIVDYFLEHGATNLQSAAYAARDAGRKDLHKYLSKKKRQCNSTKKW